MSKSEKSKILDFLTNCHTYMGNRLAHKKIHKQKMQGAGSFVAAPSAVRGMGKKSSVVGVVHVDACAQLNCAK